MSEPIYSILDGATCGPNLEIQESGLVLAANAPALDLERRTLARIAKTSGVWMYEAAYYGDDEAAAAGCISFGIAQAPTSLVQSVGIDSNSYGYYAADGDVYNNGAPDATCPGTPPKTYIQIVADLDALEMRVYIAGSLAATQAIAGCHGFVGYQPAFSICSPHAYGLKLFVNFGQRTFAYPITGASGWYTAPANPPALYLGAVGDQAYSSAATDTPANQNYDPAILNLDDLVIEKSATCYLWSDRSNSSTYSSIDIDNTFRKYNGLLEKDYRDAPVYFRMLDGNDNTLSNVAHTIATAFVDRVEEVSEDRIRVYLRSKIETLKKPLQRRYFPPFVDKGIAGRPVPIIIGAARSVDIGAQLVSEPARTYQLNGSQVANVGIVRDKGNPLDPNASPPQWNLTNDLQAIVVDTLPQGTLTGDVSTCGTQNTYPGQPDVLAGHGSDWDTTWTGPSPPPPGGWTLTNTDAPTYSSTALKATIVTPSGTHTAITLASNRPVTSIGGVKRFSLQFPGILRARKTYRIRFKMWSQLDGGIQPGGGLVLLSAFGSYLQSSQWISPPQVPVVGGMNSDLPFMFVYTVPAGATRDLIFSVCGSTIGGQVTACTIYDIVVEELAETITDVPLVGASFAYYYDVVFGQLARMAASEWSASDLATLDANYPGAPLGVQIAEAITIEGAARAPMDSVCGTLQDDRLGVIRFRRLVDPRKGNVVATLTESDVDFPVVHSVDYAEGLTLTVGCQRNNKVLSDTDFVTDYTLVPAALRTQLKRRSRIQQVCNAQLQSMYKAAELAGPLDTIFDIPAIALAEISRIAVCFSIEARMAARFVFFTFNYDGIPPEYLFGDVIRLLYKSGQTTSSTDELVAIIATKLMPGKQKMQCVGWTVGVPNN